MQLHWEQEGQGPDVVLIHGLFGMGNNLGMLSRALRDDYRVTRLDLPNHGRSPWAGGYGIPAMADAVGSTLETLGLRDPVLVGHSLGGKVAMQRALTEPAAVRALVVADIAPVTYPPGHDPVFDALDAITAAAPASRREAAAILEGNLEDPRVAQFLQLSLRRGDGGAMRWRFNVPELKASYSDYRAAPAGGVFDGPTLFIKGELSAYIQEKHREAIVALFPAASVRVLSGTGHWLHAEQPRLFNAVAKRFIDRLGPA